MRDRLIKPPVRVRRASFLRSRSGQALGLRAEDELFRFAEVLTEGRLEDAAFFGSTLVTIDLARLGPSYSGDAGARSREDLLAVVSGSVRVRLRLMRIACADVAQRHPDRVFGTATTESRFRLSGTQLLIDVDLEMPIERALPRVASVRP